MEPQNSFGDQINFGVPQYVYKSSKKSKFICWLSTRPADAEFRP